MNQILFDYHYGMEAEQYAFFRIPKILMTDPIFRKLSLEAKVLYGMMMDRMVLSAKNGWRDETGRIYIYFTIEEICESFNCGKDKAVKALKELEKDIGLIERKKQGQGKPTMIFVKNFTRIIEEDTGDADLDFGNRDERPFGRRMHSLSVSDVVVLHRNGEKKAFYIDDFGFKEVSKFLGKEKKQKKKGKNDKNVKLFF